MKALRSNFLTGLLFFLLVLLLQISAHGQVKIYKGTEVIPTYQIGADEISPQFYTGRGVQGAQGKIYPYASQTKLSDELTDVTYEMLYLENEYLIVKVLPAFGGRLFSAIDKTNGHELFHTNSVIKPDLIGTLGAWVSGGIEWCFPHHHRTSTMLPSDYRMIENKDGSATIWIGETEKTMQARGIVGMTLHPGKSYIDVDYRINNMDVKTQTFLFWANVAVTANEDFRTFWPPSQEIGVFHNNRSFIKWPISNQNDDYGRTSYQEGTDLTWWKNHPNPVSFFMWDVTDGFIGGYDYGQQAGMVHVGDPIENSASKLWQFGPGKQGQNARRKLTDDGKAYVELMTGSFSNNQPDYSWILPHSAKDAKNYWYPIRDIEIAKNATEDAAVTLQMRDSKTVFYGVNVSGQQQNAKLILKNKDETLIEKIVNVDPANPFVSTYQSTEDLNEVDLFIELLDNNGATLVSYAPQAAKNTDLPKPQDKILRPDQIESVEDLYLTGRFVDQFNRPGKNPEDYYQAALEKSADDYRVNIAMGILKVDQSKHEEALEYFQVAADKLKIKYYQPKEGELYYYRGIAHRALGHEEEAVANFGRATWYYEWFSAANFQLAQMASQQSNHQQALDYIKEAYSTNNRDGRIVNLYASLLRLHDNKEEAIKLLEDQLNYDPLDFTALYEMSLLTKSNPQNQAFRSWHDNMQDVENNYLTIATHYINAGLHEDGIKLLSNLENPQNPLIHFYLAWFHSQDGNTEQAKQLIQSANNMSLDYCFPYRQESETILKHIIELDPQNARAYYLLGNLLYDHRPFEAIAHWEKASTLNNEIPIVERNLAFGAYYAEKDVNKAVTLISKAINRNPNHSLWFSELVKYYDASDLDYIACLDLLKNNLNSVKGDVTAPKRYVELLNLNGEYEEAISFLNNHHFRTWEGGRDIYWRYVDAHTLNALAKSQQGKYKEALASLRTAMEYPENLEVGKSTHDEMNAMIYYHMGSIYEKMDQEDNAKESFEKSVAAINSRSMAELFYYQALSSAKLKDGTKTEFFINKLNDEVKALRNQSSNADLIAVEEADDTASNRQRAKADYLEALSLIGSNKFSSAKALLSQSLDLYKNNLWAREIHTDLITRSK